VIDAGNRGSAQSQKQERPPNTVGGPVRAAWREGTFTRARELVALRAWVLPTHENGRDLGLSEFVPGLSALDTSAQILAWALVFGYAQQLFTRFVDRQGQTVLDSVRAADTRNDTIPP
jgi:hypothetical protein